MRVKVIHPFYDMENKEHRLPNGEFEVTEARLKVLQGDNPYKVKFVEVIEDIKLVEDTTTVEQKVDNIIVETDDIKVVIENKEEKPKKTTKKKVVKK